MTVKHLSGDELPNNSTLADFIECELSCEGLRDDIKWLIELGHMVSFEYECNQYNVMYDGINGMVTIRDAVHEENGIPEYFRRISMSAADFLKILSTKCGEL
ncbi:MAG: hypothetical protein HDR72_01935 [Ruminococcaceae bacterium]|nr:hypothetical protein [Oscillospiraceae bacterium]